MFLSWLFAGFFFVAIAFALYTLLTTGSAAPFEAMASAIFSSATNAFEIALALTGVLAFWLGIMKIGRDSGLLERLARRVAPYVGPLFPSIPANHPAMGSILMNFSANLLGLDNAATPLGLQTMSQLQQLNPDKKRASDAMIMFLAINASGLTLIPTSIMAYRMQAGSANPADIFLPILLSTTVSTVVAVLLVALKQRIRLSQPRLLVLFLSVAFVLAATLVAWWLLPAEAFSRGASATASLLLMLLVGGFLFSGLRHHVNVYTSFVQGAKQGFAVAVRTIPYLIALLVGVGVLRASGAMELFMEALRSLFSGIGIDTEWIEALPTMLMKPISGSGARAMMVDVLQNYGADSFVGRLSSCVQGATDTTLYVVSLYFGSVGITRFRYTVAYSLIADLAGMAAAVLFAYLFFG